MPLSVYSRVQADCPRGVNEPRNQGMQGIEASFWEAAALACVALRQSSGEEWRSATEAWFGGGRDFATRNCYVDTVRATMQSIMGSTPSPDSLPAIALGPSAGGYACPPHSFDLSPRQGPSGTVVTLSWSGAPWMQYSGRVLFGAEPTGFAKEGEAFISVPSPDHVPGAVSVVMALDNGDRLDFGTYTYE